MACAFGAASAIIMSAVPAPTSQAQSCGSWRQVATDVPSPRETSAMAYDSGRGVTVLFGGTQEGVYGLGDTWEWDGAHWTLVSQTGPSPRLGAAIVYDSHRGVMLLFGGFDMNHGFFGDTWEWDGAHWTQVAHTGPSPRFSPGIAYDSHRDRVILFGGNGDGSEHFGYLNDTWSWDGHQWTQVAHTGPDIRADVAMDYNAALNRIVLFGGSERFAGGGTTYYGDTWTWDGTQWDEVTDIGPSPRQACSMVYDASRQEMILFGGWTDDYYHRYTDDTWAWDGSMWNPIGQQSGPAGRASYGMCYDSARDVVVLFGGANTDVGAFQDTWEFSPSSGSFNIALTQSGCPHGGDSSVAWGCGTPNGEVALVFASGTGNFVIPPGPCAGTVLGLSHEHIQVVTTAMSDASGRGSITMHHGRRACGGFLQMVDGGTCATSNVIEIR